MHTLSAPAGAGKTSFSYALIAAVTREAEENPAAPFGCVFVVDQIERADTAYRELSELLPGKVAVWTSEHDVGAKESAEARSTREDARCAVRQSGASPLSGCRSYAQALPGQ